MTKRLRKEIIFENVRITDVAAEGKAIAKVDDLVIFVAEAIPGDVVDLKITKKKKNFAEAKPILYHEYSTDRTEPFCEHFGVCGGCKWQQLNYEKQAFYKQKQVTDSLQRIGKVDIPPTNDIIKSMKTTFYRNKLDYSFSNHRWLTTQEIGTIEDESGNNAIGFFIPGRFDRVLDIKNCWLQDEPSNKLRNEIRLFTANNGYSYYDQRKKTGYMRNIVIRTSTTGEIMVIIIFGNKDLDKQNALFDHLIPMFPEVTSWIYMINEKVNDSINDLEAFLYHGKEFINERMEDLTFKIGPKSFYQTNAEQAYNLYKVTRSFAALTGNEIVYDLYTGTGTIANFVAHQAKKVIGIEYVPEAIEDAIVNSRINNIDNTSFFAGDMKDVLNLDFIATHGQPDVIIVDPPRAGMHPDVVGTIKNANPQKIVYVSCNPATQARDISLLSDKYKVEKIQPVDMFPHTYHVENVVLLTLI